VLGEWLGKRSASLGDRPDHLPAESGCTKARIAAITDHKSVAKLAKQTWKAALETQVRNFAPILKTA